MLQVNNINILYEDNHLLVVIKEPNILCQSDKTKDLDLLTMLKNYLKIKYNKKGNVYLGLVHRLDRPVGGIMAFAKTSKAANRLSKMIQNHEVTKEYLCVCYGALNNFGTMEDYLEKIGTKSIVSDKLHGKYTKLEYTLLSKKDNLNLVKVNLITGRHHQIRVQFSKRSNPLYGDQLYGKQDKLPIALFAYHLAFMHPVKHELMNFYYYPKGEIWEIFNIERENYEGIYNK